MQTFERRIAALELAEVPDDQLTIIRRFVTPGQLDAEIYRLKSDDGDLWEREDDETEQELIARATLAVRRNDWGVASLSSDD